MNCSEDAGGASPAPVSPAAVPTTTLAAAPLIARERSNGNEWRWRRAEIILQAIGLAVAITFAVIYWFQLRSMQQALEETHRGADAAIRAADASQAQVAAMRSQIEAAQRPRLDVETLEVRAEP